MHRISIALWASFTTCETLSRLENVDWREQMLTAVNEIRAQNNLAPLGMNGKLEKAAQKHAQYMARAEIMSHVGSDQSTMLHRIEVEAYKVLSAAENVAAGQKTVAQVMEDWESSKGHFANMVGDYHCVGFGVQTGEDGKAYWCQDFGKSDVDTCETPGESGDQRESPPSRSPLSNKQLPPIKSPPPELYPYSTKYPSPPVLSISAPKIPSPPLSSPVVSLSIPKMPPPPPSSPVVSLSISKMPSAAPITPSQLLALKSSLISDVQTPVPPFVQDILTNLGQPINFEKVPAVPVISNDDQYLKSFRYDNENKAPVGKVEAAEYEKFTSQPSSPTPSQPSSPTPSQPSSQPTVNIMPSNSDRLTEFDSERIHC